MCSLHYNNCIIIGLYVVLLVLSNQPLFVSIADVVQQDVVFEGVWDEPLGVSVVSTVLDPVLLLRELLKLLSGDAFLRRHHQHTCTCGVNEYAH